MKLIRESEMNEATSSQWPKKIGDFELVRGRKGEVRYWIEDSRRYFTGQVDIEVDQDNQPTHLGFSLDDPPQGAAGYVQADFDISSASIDDVVKALYHTNEQVQKLVELCDGVRREFERDPGLWPSTLSMKGMIIHSYGEFGRSIRIFDETCRATENDLMKALK